MEKTKMNKTMAGLIITLILFALAATAFPQDQEEAVKYLDAVMEKNRQISAATWEYIKAGALRGRIEVLP